jgi:phosphatidylserine/phosphatidylglycerophosphate/cardiolipin synthase-like enzyme
LIGVTAVETKFAREPCDCRQRWSAAEALPDRSNSAFRLLPLAAAAYDTRIERARQAQRTLDVQSFVFKGDRTGAYLLGSLRACATQPRGACGFEIA